MAPRFRNTYIIFLISSIHFVASKSSFTQPQLPTPPRCPIESELASNLSKVALKSLETEFPINYVIALSGPDDLALPIELTPVFYGSYDWHSAVHTHWQLVRLIRSQPEADFVPIVAIYLTTAFTEDKLNQEYKFFAVDHRTGFERPYGLAWLLALVAELHEFSNDPTNPIVEITRQWIKWFAPLEELFVERITDWIVKLPSPIRIGEHSQTAFALGLLLDYTEVVQNTEFKQILTQRALAFHANDRNCPLHIEPSGHDFLSPCLAQADLMRRILRSEDFALWLALNFEIPQDGSSAWLEPVVVIDPTDGKLAHWDGLNLSRAWMLREIAVALPPSDARIRSLLAVEERHRVAGLSSVGDPDEMDYAGSHWLGSFAVYLETCRSG